MTPTYVHRISVLLIAAVCIATTIGCDMEVQDPPSTLILDWQLIAGCSASQVMTVEAKVFSVDGLPSDGPLRLAKSACASPEPITISDIPHGHYRVQIEGQDKSGFGTYVGTIEDIALEMGQITVPDKVVLSQKKGAIDITWFFGNGMLCSANHVTSVQIAVFDSNTSAQLYEAELAAPFPCDPFDLPEDLRSIGNTPDPTHEVGGVLIGNLNPSTYALYAFGLNETGEKIRKGAGEVSVELGRIVSGVIELVECGADEPKNVACD